MRKSTKTVLLIGFLLGAFVALKGFVLAIPSGTWQATGNLSAARTGASAALLQNGSVLITGGDPGSGPVASADLFNSDGSVSPLAAPMNNPRSNHISTTLQDGRVLVAGGTVSGGGATNSAEIYDPLSGTWTSIAGGMVEARSGAAAALLQDGRVLIAGGESSGVASTTLEIFDPVAGTFSAAGVMSSPRTKHAMAVLADGRVIIIGGSNGTAPVATTDILNPVAGSVAAGPSLATRRSGHSATTLLDGRVLVAGGNNIVTNADGSTTTVDLASAEIFDPTAGTFTTSASALATARAGHLAFLLPHNNNVLIVGGTSNGISISSAELFTPWQGTFSATGSLSTARSNAAGSAMQQDGLLLVAGGKDAATPPNALSSTEVYGFATVKTDAADYPPGTTVNITGSGWQPGETVTLTLVESPLIDTHGPYTVTADANGHISDSSFVTDEHDLNVKFSLTAVGSVSQAQTAFTDTATFTINFSGSNAGTVTSSSPSGITNCAWSGTTKTGTCTAANLSNNTTVTLNANTPANWTIPSAYTVVSCTNPTASCQFKVDNGPSNTVIASFLPPSAPTITSANSATLVVGALGTFTVTTTGAPTPTLTRAGTLPGGVTFTDNGNGTATLSGTPAANTGGIYPITITASNGVLPNATQNFTLTVNQAPAITSANNTTFTVGTAGAFTLTASGFPTTMTFSETGSLPSGVTLSSAGVLGGTPAAGTAGTYNITITASNGVTPNGTQSFTLTVNQAPAITSADNKTFAVGVAGTTFTVTKTGSPTPTLSESGALPSGVSFNASTGVLSGTPVAGTAGTYPITFTASNGVLPNATQSFTLTVENLPTVTINQAVSQADPTNTSPMNFTIVFSTPVTGFTSAGVTISGTAGGTKTKTLTGSGTTYNVAVGGMTSNGTVVATVGANAAQDVAGFGNTVSTSGDNTVTWDITAPTAAIVYSSTGPVKAGTSLTITATFNEPMADSPVVQFSISGANTMAATSMTKVDSTHYTGTHIVGTGNGTATVAFSTGTDLAGNLITSSPTSGATFTVDNTPPTVTISAPSVALTKSGPVTYTVTYADTFFNSSTLASGNITLNTTGTASATTIGITGTGTTRTVTLSGISGDGTIGISIAAGTASDTAGNLAPAAGPSATFTVDNSAPAAPSAPILAAASDSGTVGDNITNNTTPTFTGAAEAGSTVTILVDGVSKGSGTAAGGNYSITTTALTAGTHSITATAADAAGNISTSSGALLITIDTTAPTVTVNQAASQADPTNVSPINFTVVFSKTVTDFSCSSVTLGGSIAGASKSCGTITGAGLTYNVPVNITGTVSGTVQLSIGGNKVHDVAGNGNTASTSTDSTITFDNVPPSAPSTPDMTAATDSGISNTDNITNVTTPVFTGTAATGTAVSIFSDGILVGTGTAANYNSPGITVSALLDGAHSITARATDAVGNVSVPSGALSITIDTIAPTTPPSAPALLPSTVGNPEDGVTTSTTPSFYGTSTDATAGFVAIYSDGVQVGSGSVSNYQNSGLGVSVTAPLALGPHTITVACIATAGNVSGSSAPSSITLINTIKETDIGTASTGNVTASTLNETGVNVAAGNTVFVTVAMDPDAQIVTVSDTGSGGTNIYTNDADVTTGSGTSGIRTLIFSAFVNHALSAGTITISSVTPANMVATFFYFNGIVSSSPKDLCHTGAGIGITKNTTVLTSGITATAATCTGSTPAATSQADELLIGGLGLNDQGGSLTPGDSFTNLAKSQNGGGASHTFQVQPSYLVVKNTGQYAAAWTYNMDSSKHWAAAIATYKIVTPTIVSIVMDSASITTLPATTNLNNVNFTVTFSEPVFGVDAEDFALVSTGVSGSSITGVITSDNTVYSIAVSTGTGNGTIQLNYHDDADLTVDANNIPLNGSAAGAVTVPGLLYTVSKSIATTTAVSSSNASPAYGQSVTFTATVTPNSGSTTPTGSVTFYDSATCSGTILAGPTNLDLNG